MDLEKQYDKLLRYCYMRVRNAAAAEDITQEAFLRLLGSRSYSDTGKELAYLYVIAKNLCTDHFRKRSEMLLEDLSPGEFSRDEEQKLLEKISVECAMDKLEEEEREIVMLRYSSELPIGQISQAMGISRFAVHRRLTAAMEKLRKEMEQ